MIVVDASQERSEVDRLLVDGEVAMVGAVLAELLQGTRNRLEFDELHDDLTDLPYLSETKDTWSLVGTLARKLRQQGRPMSIRPAHRSAGLGGRLFRVYAGRALPARAGVAVAPGRRRLI